MEKNPIFQFIPDPDFSEKYNVCKNTGLKEYRQAKNRHYVEDYFMEEYKNQYGKTYFEDEENIRSLSKDRLSVLSEFMSLKGKSLLEAGSAAGFFLSEASKLGMIPSGIEIAKKVAEYSIQNGCSVKIQTFQDYKITQQFDVFAAFFVIEHLENPEFVWNKINSLIKPGGFLLLGLPSINGPTFKTNPAAWFDTHPSDHYYDYSPNILRNILRFYQFTLLKAIPMSYHKNRDQGFRGFLPGFLYKVLARIYEYGDTILIVAKKKNIE